MPGNPATATPYAPFTSRIVRFAWRPALGSLVSLIVFMVTLWE